jgi:hypothetical protein
LLHRHYAFGYTRGDGGKRRCLGGLALLLVRIKIFEAVKLGETVYFRQRMIVQQPLNEFKA